MAHQSEVRYWWNSLLKNLVQPFNRPEYRIAGGFRGPIFSRIANGSNFAKNIFVIRPKHVGALREEGVAPKFSRLAEIPEIRENKCPRKNPACHRIF